MFALSGKKIDKGYSIENSKDFFVVEAIGDRAMQLKTDAQKLRATPTAEREVLEVATGQARDYTNEQGVQSFAKILSGMTTKTNIKHIDEENTLWQLNWVEVAWPEGAEEELCTKDGRLWFLTTVRDGTGLSPKMRMNEASALALAQVDSKDMFLELHRANQHPFPAMATVKVLREVKIIQSGGSHPTLSASPEEKEYINFTIVHAADQPMNEKPSQSTLELVPLMPQIEFDSACIVPAALHMVKASWHYAFQIQMKPADGQAAVTIPCQKIVSLVKSTKNSSTQSLGTVGFKVVTREVECLLGEYLAPDDPARNLKFVLSSTCPVDNVTSYKLDPPRKGVQYALVTITGKIDDVFVVDHVQHLEDKEAQHAKESLWQLLLLAGSICQQDLKRNAPWTETASPAKAKRCRILGRAPTDKLTS